MDTEPAHLPFVGKRPGPNVPAACVSPFDCFSIFFNDSLWQFLVDSTNEYTKKMTSGAGTAGSLYWNWKPVSVKEMKAFVAIILNMGIIQLTNLKDYWSTQHTVNISFFRSVFSRNRFFQIFGALHVGDVKSTLKRDKIQPLLDRLLPAFQSAFSPSQEVSIDEAIISFRGRVSFRQYLKGKPNPWGIKAFVLAGSKTGYLHNVLVYYGRETQLIQNDLPHTVRVVLTLMEGLEHKGHDLFVDRYYSSPLLALELDKLGITITGKILHTSSKLCSYNH